MSSSSYLLLECVHVYSKYVRVYARVELDGVHRVLLQQQSTADRRDAEHNLWCRGDSNVTEGGNANNFLNIMAASRSAYEAYAHSHQFHKNPGAQSATIRNATRVQSNVPTCNQSAMCNQHRFFYGIQSRAFSTSYPGHRSRPISPLTSLVFFTFSIIDTWWESIAFHFCINHTLMYALLL